MVGAQTISDQPMGFWDASLRRSELRGEREKRPSKEEEPNAIRIVLENLPVIQKIDRRGYGPDRIGPSLELIGRTFQENGGLPRRIVQTLSIKLIEALDGVLKKKGPRWSESRTLALWVLSVIAQSPSTYIGKGAHSALASIADNKRNQYDADASQGASYYISAPPRSETRIAGTRGLDKVLGEYTQQNGLGNLQTTIDVAREELEALMPPGIMEQLSEEDVDRLYNLLRLKPVAAEAVAPSAEQIRGIFSPTLIDSMAFGLGFVEADTSLNAADLAAVWRSVFTLAPSNNRMLVIVMTGNHQEEIHQRAEALNLHAEEHYNGRFLFVEGKAGDSYAKTRDRIFNPADKGLSLARAKLLALANVLGNRAGLKDKMTLTTLRSYSAAAEGPDAIKAQGLDSLPPMKLHLLKTEALDRAVQDEKLQWAITASLTLLLAGYQDLGERSEVERTGLLRQIEKGSLKRVGDHYTASFDPQPDFVEAYRILAQAARVTEAAA